MAFHLNIYAESINLIFQLMILAMVFYGYRAFKSKDFAKHGNAMAATMFLNIVSIVLVMIPDFAVHAVNFDLFALPIIPHGIAGALAQGLAIYIFVRWISNNFDPSRCAGRTLMRTTMYAWVISSVSGIIVYLFHLFLP